MTGQQLRVMNKYFGCRSAKEAQILADLLRIKQVERTQMMLEYCDAHPERCEYFTSKRGTKLVRVHHTTGAVKQYEVRHLATTPNHEDWREEVGA